MMRADNLKSLRPPKRLLVIVAAVILLLGVGVVSLRTWYVHNLKPVSSSSSTVYFTVTPGASLHQIAVKLKSAGLIRNSRVFETYVRSNELHDKLQAGTYSLGTSMSVEQIVKKIVDGDVAKNLLTILPQKRLDEVKQAFTAAGYSAGQINQAFDPASYRGHPVLANLPAGASLEGYLYPDSFEKQADTPATDIVRQSLDEMQKFLSQDTINGFGAHSLSVYQGLTLASIVAQETDDPAYQPMVAQVFLSRLAANMALGSDVTAFYASAIAGLSSPSLGIDSPYNTRLHPGLPPGPISNMTKDALNAVAHPATTDYLYFVAGDDKKIHFSRTQAEHEDAVKKYCTKECQ
jgi:UPF0755 protein